MQCFYNHEWTRIATNKVGLACRSFRDFRVNSRGYEFCHRGVLDYSGRSCRTGESEVTLRTCWSANQQVGLREMLEDYDWSHSPLSRMSTGAKHLHGDRPAYLSACKRLTRFRPSA